MDFLHPDKKRRTQIKLFIGYGLMGLSLIISTVIIVLLTGGYDYDPSTRQVITKGMFVIDSHPVSSDIYINGTKRGTTNSRYALPTGNYDIELRRDGYREWKHSYTLESKTIEQLVYP